MKTSESMVDLYKALIKAQSEFKVALKDTQNSFTNKNYADFQSVVDAAKEALTKNDLGFIQTPSISENGLILITRIFHASGQFFETSAPVKSIKEDPQSIGAAITYMKRYALQAALGIVASDEDDDAEKAMGKNRDDRSASKADIITMLKKYQGIGIGEKQVLSYLGISKPEEMKESDLSSLAKIGSEIKAGKVKKEEYFK